MSIGESISLADLELDPYPHLARLRAAEPVSYVPALDMWLVTRWDDVQFVHDRPELFTSATEPSWLNTVLGRNMLGCDGAEHRRLKDALQPSFAPTDGIALTVWALLTHPDALDACRHDDALWRNACEELFRWVSPVATSTRQATVDVTVAGTEIPRGALVAAVLSSANRDERRWTEPDRYLLHRREGAHLAFSTGAHVCLGAWLGRSTVRVAVQRLFQRLPSLHLSAPVEVRGFEFRGPLRLVVGW